MSVEKYTNFYTLWNQRIFIFLSWFYFIFYLEFENKLFTVEKSKMHQKVFNDLNSWDSIGEYFKFSKFFIVGNFGEVRALLLHPMSKMLKLGLQPCSLCNNVLNKIRVVCCSIQDVYRYC